jgi:hypothetical protein
MKKCLEVQAVEALKALLRQLSAVKVRDISIESPGPKHRKEIVARIDVYGRHHTLFCQVRANGEPRNVQMVLGELQEFALQDDEEVTPVLIAPQLSTEAQALCRQRRLGFLDLEGNAHLELKEVFFGKRCLPRRMSASH